MGSQEEDEPARSKPSTRDTQLAFLSMALLVFQGTALSLTLRYSRTSPGDNFLASVAVIFTEALKLLVCFGVQLFDCKSNVREGGTFRQEFKRQFQDVVRTSTPMAIPAGLFVMQQVLVIIAASHLDAVTFQIFSQSFKIMPTAVFAWWLLGQQLTALQWSSLPVLAVGVVFVSYNSSSSQAQTQNQPISADTLVGMAASSLSGVSSAYAGVYFEKYVKGKHSATLWVRNLQLSLYGLVFSFIYMMAKDGNTVRQGGLLQGFDYVAWLVVALQVFGGLTVGMVVKYADNILKNFANALSVIFTVLGVIPLFGQYPSTSFLFGVLLVLLSVFMYSQALADLLDKNCGKCSAGNVCLPKHQSHRRQGAVECTFQNFCYIVSAVVAAVVVGAVIYVSYFDYANFAANWQPGSMRGLDKFGSVGT